MNLNNSLTILLLLILLGFVVIFRKDINKKITKKLYPKKELFISSELSEKDQKVIMLLNKALADEWLAYYQYWIGSKIIMGEFRNDAIKELVEHANDEYKHANMLVARILEIGGIPILNHKKLEKISNCGFAVPPSTGDYKIILEQNIDGERCAIEVYTELLEFIGDDYKALKDDLLFILEEEKKHEEDLKKLISK